MAIASGEIIAAPRRHFRPIAALAEALSAEGERRVHWLPVFLGSGIAIYFALTVEPPWWLGLAATLASVAVAVTLRRVPTVRTTALLLALPAAGFALIQFAAWRHGTPMLDHRLGSVALTGLVIEIDQVEGAGAPSSPPTRCRALCLRSSRGACASAYRRLAILYSPAS